LRAQLICQNAPVPDPQRQAALMLEQQGKNREAVAACMFT